MLIVEEITDLDTVQKISAQWNKLLERTSHPDLFRTAEWTISWCQSLNTRQNNLCVLVVKDEERLVAIAPLMKVRSSFIGMPVVKIEFISMWKYAGSAASCLGEMDFIIPEKSDEVIEAIVHYLCTNVAGWHFIRLHPVPKTSQTLLSLKKIAVQKALVYEEKIISPAAKIYHSSRANGYRAELSPKFRKTLGESERRLAREGTVEYEEHAVGEKIEEIFTEILDIERRSWKWEKGIAINSTAFRNFYPTLAKTTAGNGWLSIWFLTLNGKKIAYGLFFSINGRVEFLKTAYDEQFHSCSPGTLLMIHAFEKFFQRGALSINLLAGNFDSKNRWKTNAEERSEILIFKNSWYSILLYTLYYRMSLYGKFATLEILFKRILRKLRIYWKKSELTRIDQVSTNSWS